MNISKQLMTMLGLSLLGFILIFSISLSKMDQVFEKTNTCNVNSLPSILVMDDLLQGIYRIRLILWETTTSDSHDANEFQKLMERYKTAKTKFDKDYKSYELLLSDALSWFNSQRDLTRLRCVLLMQSLRFFYFNRRRCQVY